MAPTQIAIIGTGKITQDQHIPVLGAHPAFDLRCGIHPRGKTVPNLPVLKSLDEALAMFPELSAVTIATPPQVRTELAVEALERGLAVFLEKPPAMTPLEAAMLTRLAEEKGQVIFASWHSRFAPMVSRAKEWVQSQSIESVLVQWREDAHKWHPGQHWLWQPGGLGVFDPGINGLSILTEIFDGAPIVSEAAFEVPENAHTPIGVRMALKVGDVPVEVDLDFREQGDECWQIILRTHDGKEAVLSRGGAAFSLGQGPDETALEAEYKGLYDRFAALVKEGRSEMDLRPLQIAADAFFIARITKSAPFHP